MLPITVATPADVAARRAALRGLIWPPAGGYPTYARPTVTPAYQFAWWNGLPNLKQVDRLTYWTYIGSVDGYHFRPTASSGRSMLYCDGHQFGLLASWVRSIVAGLLAAGIDVVYQPLPLFSLHDPADGDHWDTWQPPVLNGVTVTNHDVLPRFRTPTFYPLTWFLTPLVGTVGYLIDVTGRPTVAMMGVSGGGLMTEIMAALDERITRSYPVAAGHPPALWPAGYHVCWEYHDAELYGTVPLQDAYVMGASNGRRQVKILNERDGLFGASAGLQQQYAPAVAAAAASLGGSWGCWIDVGSATHWVSPAAVGRIIADQWEGG